MLLASIKVQKYIRRQPEGKDLAVGKISEERIEASVNAFYGYVKHTKWDGYSYQALAASGMRFPEHRKR
ncbi:MAG: hypothetical protein SPD11_12840 [Sphaerochaetaceae bacterium]|nr:hypothetical protein [Sphaerochaetaceae bacterium]